MKENTLYSVEGTYYESLEEALENARELIDRDEFLTLLLNEIGMTQLMEWAMSNSSFLEHFEPEIYKIETELAEQLVFEESEYWKDPEDWEDDVDECGYNPYMGGYDFDC